MESIIKHFLPEAEVLSFEKISVGLIHQTFKILVEGLNTEKAYILQEMNKSTFKKPSQVLENICLVQDFLFKQNYRLVFPNIISTIHSIPFFKDAENRYWRMFSYVENSICYEMPPSDEHLYQAGKAYGLFLSAIRDLDPNLLHITIPDFHNLGQRFQQFELTLKKAFATRKLKAKTEIDEALNFYKQFQFDFSKLPIRVVHNDSKLSNVLFDEHTQECIAVIDLDTLMPGYVITDFGDMVRGMCNTATEDEIDLAKVSFDIKRFEYLQKGFLKATEQWLSPAEKKNLYNGAIYIIFEQAIRFLSDYLDNDQYYSIKYAEHNLDRAKNQLKLLRSMLGENIEHSI